MKKYRKLYKDYYGIDFGEEFDIHHIDFDRTNNQIDNLILLPKAVHNKYHFCVKALQEGIEYGIEWQHPNTFKLSILRNFCDVMAEIEKWKMYKIQLEINKKNEVE